MGLAPVETFHRQSSVLRDTDGCPAVQFQGGLVQGIAGYHSGFSNIFPRGNNCSFETGPLYHFCSIDLFEITAL